MKFAINAVAAALLLLASAPAFARGGGMGHMSGNMGTNMSGNMGKTSQPPTVIGRHDGDRHMHSRYTKTTKIHTHLKTLTDKKVARIKQKIERLKLELIKLKADGRGNSFEARRLLYREMNLAKLINT